MFWLGILTILILVAIEILLFISAVRANPMYQEIKLHTTEIKELRSRGQEQQILEENKVFDKKMRELAESDNSSSVPCGFLG